VPPDIGTEADYVSLAQCAYGRIHRGCLPHAGAGAELTVGERADVALLDCFRGGVVHLGAYDAAALMEALAR
jgi:hypothetical protein